MRERHTIFRIGEKVHLVDVERMQFGGCVESAPTLICTYAGAGHRTCVRLILATIDVEAILVLGEDDGEVQFSFLQRLYVDRLIEWRPVIDSMNLLSRVCTRSWLR